MSDYIDLRQDLLPMDSKIESELRLIEAKASWALLHDEMERAKQKAQEAEALLFEAEIWLDIAYNNLMAALGSYRWLAWGHVRRN